MSVVHNMTPERGPQHEIPRGRVYMTPAQQAVLSLRCEFLGRSIAH